MSIQDFLRGIGLDQYVMQFEKEGVEVADLRELSDADLRDTLGVTRLMDRKRILATAQGELPSTATPSQASGTAYGSYVASSTVGGALATPFGASVAWSPSGGPPPSPSPFVPPVAAQGPVPTPTARLLDDGLRVGDFMIEAMLGRGGFGEVYRAQHLTTGETLALKVVPLYASCAHLVQSVVREWTLLRHVRHPGLLENERPHQTDARGMQLLLMPMTYADGGALRDWLVRSQPQRAQPDAREGLLIEGVGALKQVAAGLAALHEAGRVHLDLKPENILRVADQWKVADFGLSRDLEAVRSAGPGGLPEVVGSPAYMSPEQFLAARPQDVGPKADIWAFGVLLFEMLDGHVPFHATSIEAMRSKLVGSTVRPNTTVLPVAFRALVDACLEREQAARPNANELATAVAAALTRLGATENCEGVAPISSLNGRTSTTNSRRAVVVVDPSGHGDAQTLEEALGLVSNEGTIRLAPGTYEGGFVLRSDITIESVSPGVSTSATIRSVAAPCVTIQAGAPTLRSLRFEQVGEYTTGNDLNAFSAVVVLAGSPALVDCLLTSRWARGLHAQGATVSPTLTHCRIEACGYDGLLYQDSAAGSMTECISAHNGSSGVRVQTCGNPTVRSCRFYGNGDLPRHIWESEWESELAIGRPNEITVDRNGAGTFEGCESYGSGSAGIEVRDGGNPTVRDCRFYDTWVGISVIDATGTFEGCESFANRQCGMQVNGGNPKVRSCKFHGVREGHGIEVLNDGGGTFDGCESFANWLCGIVVTKGGNPTIHDCKFHGSRNSGIYISDGGAGVFVASESYANENAGISVMMDSAGTFDSCKAYANAREGIQVGFRADPTVRNCTFYDARETAGIGVHENGTGTFEGCEAYGNKMTGVQITSGGNPKISNCSFR